MNCKGKVFLKQKSGAPLCPIEAAVVTCRNDSGQFRAVCDKNGYYECTGMPAGKYTLHCEHFGCKVERETEIGAVADTNEDCVLECDLAISLWEECDCKPRLVSAPVAGRPYSARLNASSEKTLESIKLKAEGAIVIPSATSNNVWDLVVNIDAVLLSLELDLHEMPSAAPAAARIKIQYNSVVLPAPATKVQTDVSGRVQLQDPVNVRLQRPASDPTEDQALWVAIRNRTRAISFDRYHRFMLKALLQEEGSAPGGLQAWAAREFERDVKDLGANLHGVGAYQTLKMLTETFLILQCGVRLEREKEPNTRFDSWSESRRLGRPFRFEEISEILKRYLGGDRHQLPYITRVVEALFPDLMNDGPGDRLIGARRLNEPLLIELIWSYWMEEGMLVQTMNAVSQRFQNVRGPNERDPLMNLEIDPLRPLNNLIWGYIQDEYNRLSVRRRAYEYTHHYGLTLYGKATAGMQPADTRSKFLEAFHNLLYQTSVFFKEDFQTTVIADGYPLLTALREVHLIMASGAQNQFGDLPWTARVEMMLMQFMLSRREIHDFLGGRVMVPYREAWEPQVDAMKTLQGWTDVTVTHFRDLAAYGEQILLSIRYGDWIADNDEYSAINWARYFRPELQGYLHAYRMVTGKDLTRPDSVDATIPGVLLQNRSAERQQQRAR
jgi:hypothetical protein